MLCVRLCHPSDGVKISSASKANDLRVLFSASNFLLSNLFQHHLRAIYTTRLFSHLHPSTTTFYLSLMPHSTDHALYRAKNRVPRRTAHNRSWTTDRHATTATSNIEHYSPKLNTSASIALHPVS